MHHPTPHWKPLLSYFNITSNTFHGHLPSELARLHRLNVVNFGVNNFSGDVPSWFGNLPKLQYLHLANNSFTGLVPPFIGNISTLESLNLRFNFLEGGVPEEIGYLPKLKWLRMQFNQFSGSIPPTIFNISSLELIDFAHNMMSGSLPEDLCAFLPKLEFLRLSHNEFDGRIPTTLGECRELQILSLSYNKFSGFIPKAIGNLTCFRFCILVTTTLKRTIRKLFIIVASEIPQELGSLDSLEFLAIESANLTGLIPSSIYNSSSLKELHLQRNKLTGNSPRAIDNCTLLSVLHLGENNLTGLIPEEIGELPNVRELRLCTNNLMAAIPTSIFNNSSLQVMSLTENNLSSNLPSSIGLWLPNLSFLLLPTNKLTGIIPESISNASKLIALDLSNNSFAGSILKSLGNLRLLKYLHLDGNNLMSGSSSSSSELSFLTSSVNCKDFKKLLINRNPLDNILPTTIGNLSASLEEFKVDSCGIKGNIPSEIGNISNLLQILDLSNNKLQGSIPDDICQLKNMGDLRLNQNESFGLIPECLGNITSLNILEINLSSNSLNGNLPPQLGSFKVATLIDFSMNQFTGKIPSTIIGLQNLITLSLAHNKLQGSIPNSFGSMVSLEFLYLSYNDISDVIPKSLETLRNKTPSNVDLLPRITPSRITYQQLFRATNGFSKSNLLGMGSFGSIYKAIVEDTTVLAIKVFNLQVKGAFKSFEVECDTFVIVILLRSLRLDIMIDVACALEYLHNDYSMPLVHCDLKPNNILLDGDMVAHVSDFGIAKLLDLGESVRYTMTIATFGYIAPEFGLEGLISTTCDVHSYGILLMETFTSVKPIGEMFFEDMTMTRWIRESLPNAISHVIDANLLKPEEEHLTTVVLQCVSSIVELALSCSAESSEERMNMKDVLAILKKVKLWYLANCGRS
ncbi:unnamed protein product [Camellia sinensis]